MHPFRAIVAFVALFIFLTTLSIAEENLLGSSRFSRDDGWSVFIGKQAKDAGSTYEFLDGSVIVKSAITEKQSYSNIQIMKSAELTAEKEYKLTMNINSDKAGVLFLNYTLRGAPYTAYANAKIELEASDQEYSCVLSVKSKAGENAEAKCIRLCAGAFEDAQLTFSNISIEEIK